MSRLPASTRWIAHPGVDRLERLHTEDRVVDGPDQGVAGAADHVLDVDALLVQPGQPTGSPLQVLVLVGTGIPGLGSAVRVVLFPHAIRHQPLNRHALFSGHAAEQIVGDEVGEHLRRPHHKAGVVGREPLGQLRLQRRELVQPVGGWLEVRVDVDDRHASPFVTYRRE